MPGIKLGIVGAEGKKFTTKAEQAAKAEIRRLIEFYEPTAVCSGECHLGGIDKWAHEVADELNIPFQAFPPRELNWEHGYKPRNLQIARFSDLVVNITVDKLPPDFKGMRFETCYHCDKNGRSGTDHIKSGGCWTAFQAIKLGKEAKWITISNSE